MGLNRIGQFIESMRDRFQHYPVFASVQNFVINALTHRLAQSDLGSFFPDTQINCYMPDFGNPKLVAHLFNVALGDS